MKQTGEVNLHLVLTIFLGFGMVLFGVLAIVAYQDNHHTQTHLSALNATAAAQAAVTQKKVDTIANAKANELPYQTYIADPVDGSLCS
jgi:translation initiation factor 2 gamma subunit (eIF-2gamma)